MLVFDANSRRRLHGAHDPVHEFTDGTEPPFDIARLLGPIRRRLRLIASTIAIVLILTALALLAITPRYSASALIQIDPGSKNLLDPNASQIGSSADNARVESEVGILRSQAILLAVIRQNQLDSDAEFAREGLVGWFLTTLRLRAPRALSSQELTQLTLERFGKQVAISRVGSTYLISVTVQSRDPAKAARLANSIADTYIRAQVDAKIGATLAAREVLGKRIEQASDSIKTSEAEFETFIATNLDRIAQQDGSADLIELRERLAAARQSHENDLLAVRGLESSVQGGDWSAVAEALQSEVIRQLGAERARVNAEIEAAAAGAATAGLRAELARIDSELTAQATAGTAALRQRLGRSETDIAGLRRSVREAVLQKNLPSDVLTQLYQLQKDAEIARSQYQTLLSRLREMETQSDLQIADGRVVSQALPPMRASFPNVLLVLTLATAGSIALGVSLAYVYENYIGGFLTEEQVASVLGIPRVFPVPLQSRPGREGHQSSIADIVVDAPTSRYSEAIRRIWVAIEQARARKKAPDPAAGRAGLVVMVTSASPAEGKTTLATALARSFTQEGRRTLLVDCDLRKPSVHRQTHVDVAVGLQDLLAMPSQSKISDNIILRDTKTDLRIIGGRRNGERMPNTLIAGAEFKRVIDLAVKSYDIVILDSPPIEPIVDGLYIAQYADVLVFSVVWARTGQREAVAALEAIAAARDRPLDVMCVLNKRQGGHFNAAGYEGYYEG